MSQHLSDGISPVELKADGATVSSANPLPVTGAVTLSGELEIKNDTGNPVPISQSTHDNLNLNANIQVGNTDVSDTNPIPVSYPEVDSTANSTTTPLGISGVFTGSWESIADYDYLDIILYTDQNSATNGATISFSTDGGTTTHKLIANTIIGGVGAFLYGIPVGAFTHFKIVYTNGTTGQSTFVIKTIKRVGPIPQPLAPLGATLDETLTIGLTRAIMAAKKDNGAFANLTTTNDGYMKIAISEHVVETPVKALTTMLINQMDVTNSAAQLSLSTTSRKTVAVKALIGNTQNVYINKTNAVTTGNGWELAPGDAIELDITEGLALWAIATSGTQRICFAEVAS